jgi:serine/threonine protein phosphatase PrpC
MFNEVVAKSQNGDDGHDNMTAILIVPKKWKPFKTILYCDCLSLY